MTAMMTNLQLDELLRTNIEIEGLIRVMMSRPNDEAERMLREKLGQFAALCSDECEPVPETEAGEAPEAVADEPVYAAESDDIRVDEMLSRREARDLTKAFTLNDKFRFIRELFSNDKESFDSALCLIMKMDAFPEAEAYLYNDMHMDPDDATVQDFMAIVANHFNGR